MSKSEKLKDRFILFLMAAFVIIVIFVYTNSTRRRTYEYARDTVLENTSRISEQISTYTRTIKKINHDSSTEEIKKENIQNSTLFLKEVLPITIKADFFGKTMISILCDNDNMAICSTLEHENKATLTQLLQSIGIQEKWIEFFNENTKTENTEVFRFDGMKGYSYACVYPIEDMDWSIILIVPAPAFHEVLYKSIYDEIFAISAIVLMFTVYLLREKIRFYKDRREHEVRETLLESESLHDKLTGFLNRRAFDNTIKLIETEITLNNTCIIQLDVNSLKKVNDNIGHDAGDELIKAASDCIKTAFGEFGSCYRIGGDEFTVIIRNEVKKLDEQQKIFWDYQKNWKGKLVKELSISIGLVKSEDYPTESINHLLRIADEKMYANKREHYANNK